MISHRLDTFTYLSPQGFTVNGLCACGFSVRLEPMIEHKQAVQKVQVAHEEHLIKILEQAWIGAVTKCPTILPL